MWPESLLEVEEDELVHLANSEVLSRFNGYLVWSGPMHVEIHEHVGQLVETGVTSIESPR